MKSMSLETFLWLWLDIVGITVKEEKVCKEYTKIRNSWLL